MDLRREGAMAADLVAARARAAGFGGSGLQGCRRPERAGGDGFTTGWCGGRKSADLVVSAHELHMEVSADGWIARGCGRLHILRLGSHARDVNLHHLGRFFGQPNNRTFMTAVGAHF